MIATFSFVMQTHPKLFRRLSGFTLIELLLSMTVLAVLMILVTSIMGQIQSSWRRVSSKVSQFREARQAFDRMTSTLSQATLNNYLAYEYDNAVNPLAPQRNPVRKGLFEPPLGYVRFSELQFICGPTSELLGGGGDAKPGHAVFFQAPIGFTDFSKSPPLRVPTALNAVGYYVSFGDDSTYRPPFLNSRTPSPSLKPRYRLIEFRPPTNFNQIYDETTRDIQKDWFVSGAMNKSAWSRPLADNIFALIVSPRRPKTSAGSENTRDIADKYKYDSVPPLAEKARQEAKDYELPPIVDICMFALDEASGEKLVYGSESSASPPLALSSGLFTQADEDTFRKDIQEVERYLVDQKVNFRVFTSAVLIRSSKWRPSTIQ